MASRPTDIEAPAQSPRKTELIAMASIILALCVWSAANDLTLLALMAGILWLALLPLASWASLVFFAVMLGLSAVVNQTPIELGFAKLYGTDLLAVLLTWGVVLRLWGGKRVDRFPRSARRNERILLLLAGVYVSYGCFSLAVGLSIKGYEYGEAFGDFRRFFFYALAFAVPILMPMRERHLRALAYALTMGGGCVLLLGYFRILTDSPVREDVDSVTQHVGARMLQPDETTTLCLLLVYLLLILRSSGNTVTKLAALAGALVTFPPLLLSGYRLSIVLAVTTPFLGYLVLTWARRQPLRRFLASTLLLAAAVGLPLAAAPFVFPEQVERAQLDLMVRGQSEAAQGGWRIWTWGGAIEEWKANPIFGTAMGHRLVFPFRTSDGAFVYIDSGAHNYFIEVLYQSGLVGLILLLSFHGCFVWYALTRIRRMASRYCIIAVALFTGYISIMAGAFLQSPGVSRYVYLYLLMGFLVCLLRYTEAPETGAGQTPEP
jgi:O-antigen ligase